MLKKKSMTVSALLLSLALSACGGDPLSDEAPADGGDSSTVIIGSANFPESQLLAEIYAQALEAEGITVERRFDIGDRELYLRALDDGSIDLLPEYTGALLAALSPAGATDAVTSPDDVYDDLLKVLPEGIIALEMSSAEDKDTLAVTQATAEEYDLATIEDLAPVADQLTFGAGAAVAERYQGLQGLEDLYGITFAEFTPLDAGGPLTLGALLNGDIDVANIFSTDSAIETNDLVILDDTKNLFLAENIVPIIRESKANENIVSALNAVSAALTTDNLTEALAKVTVDLINIEDVAGEFIATHELG